METREVLAELKALGTAQNRKVYPRHGVKPPLYGVSYADLGKLKKKVKVDHGLAAELWASGIHDARVLATMVADPAQATAKQLSAWIRDCDNYVVTDAVSGLAARSPAARKLMERWTAARGEWVGAAGWNIVAQLAMRDDGLTDAELESLLATIEARIHGSANRVRYSMNNALIAIGIRNPGLEKKAIAAAERIGKVEVDHGETGCKTPDAVPYIRRAVERRQKKK